ncbi:MAG: hypothetical protein IJM92_15345 [Fibrobacter sp.]|jgi:hypothetical protein|uniref:hypothetical protein n=1 Tax=Fibrobacter sp. TaxID=35828 RepID=UPI0025BD60D2|nr:hypothetical protein [Fibrobacter sp.]MBQ3716668.1 hypothetical protein [Fibrobacter sp.]MBQ7080996.1 hypothetical protein [Fibrobacter sp.]
MFSFIKKFFERRKALAVERDSLCNELLRRVSWALSDYIDASKTKESIQKWLEDNSKLLVELSDIRGFKKSPYYGLLLQQRKKFDEFYTRVPSRINYFVAAEQKKRADAEYVSKKVNQWASEQKSQKIKASKSKELGRKIAKLTVNADDSIPANDKCSCCGKDGKKKMMYSTEGEALIVAEHRSKEIGVPLHVYPCPNGCGFHLTSNQE